MIWELTFSDLLPHYRWQYGEILADSPAIGRRKSLLRNSGKVALERASNTLFIWDRIGSGLLEQINNPYHDS
jgi:hypothetical protein